MVAPDKETRVSVRCKGSLLEITSSDCVFVQLMGSASFVSKNRLKDDMILMFKNWRSRRIDRRTWRQTMPVTAYQGRLSRDPGGALTMNRSDETMWTMTYTLSLSSRIAGPTLGSSRVALFLDGTTAI